ncbi:SseB family protein [Amnibacterium flavum]|uniref:SseB protein N-terminal domain-containing protein n=1 Tax=Amnibacterium flavum TaxID=2173173 RepID=A0A2V1HT59_9MICO|nr:SseB family protein [Amnibacterium flavum]PVZ93507.1 hypothetical protein DDQ50_14390 [Amnibacterium flavum]
MTEHDRRSDSAGQPWEGRHFEPTPYAGDDGSAPERLVEAIRRFRSGEVSEIEVVEALRGSRLLVPMLAMLGEAVPGPHGVLVDKSADLAIVTVSGPDGRAVLPAFTSVTALSQWNPKARPVPVEAERVALAAASEGTDLVILDPLSPTEFALRRTAVRSLATGDAWRQPWGDPDVISAFAATTLTEAEVTAVDLVPGDPEARLRGAELKVRLQLTPGLDRAGVDALLARLSERWGGDPTIADRVDSLQVSLS